jgi:hypothetical protein
MPGASAKGNLAHKAITKVPIIAAIAVVVKSALGSIPAADKIFGFTARI